MQFSLFTVVERNDLYVATDLTTKTVPAANNTPVEFRDGTKTFRRLDAQYLLWIKSRIANIENAYRKGKATAAVHQTVQQRYAVIQKWAKENIDAGMFDALRKDFDPKSYTPPVSELTPPATESWSIEMREAYEERAAIMEYEGGLPRIQAERAAERSVRASFGMTMER